MLCISHNVFSRLKHLEMWYVTLVSAMTVAAQKLHPISALLVLCLTSVLCKFYFKGQERKKVYI